MASRLHRIRLLGSPEFRLDEQPSGLLQSAKGVALVSYLIITGRRQERESIADLLGDAESTAQALKNLRSLLNRIRKFAPEIEATRRTLAFVPTENTEIDLYQLRTGLVAESPFAAAAAFRLYSGHLLESFYIDGAPRFNEWLTVERERLRRQVIGITHRLCQQLLDRQAWQAGIDLAQQRVQLDDLDEEAHQWLMRFLAGNGQIAQAQWQYERLRQLLWEELGVEPSAATRQIAQQLESLAPPQPPLIIRPHVTWDGGALPDPAPLPLGSIVPYRRNNDFVGRKEALRCLAEALLQTSLQPSGAIINGLGGLGKTQLAVEFAFRFGRYFPGGVYWMSFANPDGVAGEVAAIGGARGMQLYEEGARLTLADRVSQVRRAWQGLTRRLLIFDNCEDADLLAAWLPVSGGCSVLVTARMGDWPRELGLANVPLPMLTRADSVALLRKLAKQVAERDGEAIAAELGDLPLALHLAGSFLYRYPQVTVQGYLAQLRDHDLLQHPSLSGRGSMMSPTGHDLHIGRTLAITYDRLNPRDETDAIALHLLTIAACFAHGEPIAQSDLIRAAGNQPDDWMTELMASDALARLVKLGLMDSKGDENVVMHRLVAAFVETENAAQRAQTLDRVAAYLADQLAATQRATMYLGDLPLAAAHVRHVAEQGLAVGSVNAARLSSWFALHRIDAGVYPGTQRFIDEAITVLRQHQPTEALVLAHALSVGGTLLFKQGREEEAWSYYEESYSLRRRELGDKDIRTISALQNLAILHWRTGNLSESLVMFKQALQHCEALHPPEEQIMIRVLHNMGAVLGTLGRFSEAQRCHERVLKVRLRTLPAGHPHLAETHNSLGAVAYRRGDYQAAASHFTQSLQIRMQAFGADNLIVAQSHGNLGVVSVYTGDIEGGLWHIGEALRIRRLSLAEDSPAVAHALALNGHAYLLARDTQSAETYLVQALATLERVQPERVETAASQIDLARVRLAQGNVDEAAALLQRARTILAATLGLDNPNAAPVLTALGELALQMGETTVAYSYFDRVHNLLAGTAAPTHIELVRALGYLQQLSRSAE